MRSYAALLLATALLLSGCFDVHGPKGSTETGNPPVIDSSLVALVVSKDEVHLTGRRGAVTPGGSALTARNLTSMKIVHGNAAENGSFDLRVDGTRDDVFELRAASGKQMSAPLFVDRGGATVGDSDAGTLSCKQQEQLAATQIMAAVANADAACATDNDCVLVPKGAACLDSCSDVLVSQTSKAEIEATVDAINNGVCGGYADDGCMLIALPCEPPQPGSPTCVKGKCELGSATTDGGMLSCDQRMTQASSQVGQAIANADRGCMVSTDCVLAWSSSVCDRGCPVDAVSQTGSAQVDDVVAKINAGVCANFEQDGCPTAASRCPAAQMPVCSSGQCTTLDTLSCAERGMEANAEVNAAIAAADLKCTTDEGCAFAADSTDCFGGCGQSMVSFKGQAQVADAVTAINDSVCAGYQANGCGFPEPDCQSPPTPACNNGTCGEKPTP